MSKIQIVRVQKVVVAIKVSENKKDLSILNLNLLLSVGWECMVTGFKCGQDNKVTKGQLALVKRL